MGLDTERCGRCGAALVSMETDAEAIRAAGCPRCAEGSRRRQGRARSAALAVLAAILLVGAWQLLAA